MPARGRRYDYIAVEDIAAAKLVFDATLQKRKRTS